MRFITFVILFSLSILIKTLCVLLAIAFVTLFERKLLSLSQYRLGPTKAFFLGLMQPLYDGFKLLVKQHSFTINNHPFASVLGPCLSLLLIILRFFFFSRLLFRSTTSLLLVFFLVVVGVRVYSSLLRGWGRRRKYGSVGGVRSCGQSISYEISLVFIVVSVIVFVKSFSPTVINLHLFLSPLIVVLFFTVVAETIRAPFDFGEGERELISGFNIEYSSATFVFLFLGEYGIILLFSFVLALISVAVYGSNLN